MSISASFLRVDGSSVTVAPSAVTAIAAMSAAELTAAGVSQGVKLTVSGASVEVIGTLAEVTSELYSAAGAGSLVGRTVATRAALTAISAANRSDGLEVLVLTDNSHWRFKDGSSLTVDGAGMLILAPDAGTGRWMRTDPAFIAKLAIGFGTADAAALFTVPSGFAVRITGQPFYDIQTGFSGGSSSAIGMSSSAIATTKGDLLGGAAGDVAATLVAGVIAGTIGALYDTLTEQQAFFLQAAGTLRFDRITSVFTAGAGYICVPMSVVQTGAVT